MGPGLLFDSAGWLTKKLEGSIDINNNIYTDFLKFVEESQLDFNLLSIISWLEDVLPRDQCYKTFYARNL